AGLAAVAGEPLRESSHRAVIRAHLADGNVAEAVRQYRLCRRLLNDHLGLEPSDQTDGLFENIHLLATAGWRRSGGIWPSDVAVHERTAVLVIRAWVEGRELRARITHTLDIGSAKTAT